MTKLTFDSHVSLSHSYPIHVDTADLLAVHDLGFQTLTGDRYAHRRQIYIRTNEVPEGVKPSADKDAQYVKTLTVYEITKEKDTPLSISMLDNLGGKPYISAAKVGFNGCSNRSELATCLSIKISTAPQDLEIIRKSSDYGTKLASTGVAAAFTERGSVHQTIPEGTVMRYAQLHLGENAVLNLANLAQNRFAVFGALAKA